MRILILFCAIFLFASCEKEVEIDIPRSPQRLVVNAILMPSSNVEVNVSLTKHVYDTAEVIVSNAEVLLYCEDQFLSKLEHTKDGYYSKDGVVPVVGKTYSISVNVEGYNTATASTMIPYVISLDSLVISQNAATDKNGMSSIDLFFNKNTEKENYYNYLIEVRPEVIYDTIVDTFNDTTWISERHSGSTGIVCYHPAILKEGDEKTKFFSDKWIDDKQINLRIFYGILSTPYSKPVDYDVKAQIVAFSEEYYLFYKSYKNYDDKHEQILGDNNLPRLYSNVNNGLGCFSSISYSNVLTQKVKAE